MSTTLSADLTYDAPLTEVAAMLADPAFREKVAQAQGVASAHATVSGSVVTINTAYPTKDAPSFAKRFVGEEVAVVQREVWSTPAQASVEVTPAIGMATMRGTISLAEAAGRTTQSVRLDISVKVPLVGGKLETLIRDLLTKAYRKENQVGVAWLAG